VEKNLNTKFIPNFASLTKYTLVAVAKNGENTKMPEYTFNIIAIEYGCITVKAENEIEAKKLINEGENSGKVYWKNRDIKIEKLIEIKNQNKPPKK